MQNGGKNKSVAFIILFSVVINVVHYCFELRALKMTSRPVEAYDSIFLNQWDLTH